MTPELSIRILDSLLKLQKPTHELSLSEIKRRNTAQLNGPLAWLVLGQKPPLPKVVNQTVNGRHGTTPVRLYYPRLEENLPLIVFFHGGGWVTGSLETHDRLCRKIARDTGALIVAVDYRLAPSYKYPIPLEDCYDALLWASSQARSLGANPDKLMVMGDSAGGGMAAVVCLMARDHSGPKIHRQVLLYPSADGTLSCPSHQRYTEAPILPKTSVHFFRDQYMRTLADTKEVYFSPLFAENLAQLPPAFILTAEYDPLHDEAQAFAEKLAAAGVSVVYQDYPGMVHGFLHFPRFCSGTAPALSMISEYIKTATEL